MSYPMGIREQFPDEMAPVIPWERFMSHYFDWKQDQHVGLIGPTDTGKSVLTYNIVPLRDYVTFFATKPRDETLELFAKHSGYEQQPDWPFMRGRIKSTRQEAKPGDFPKRILWPDAKQLHAFERQREVFQRAMADIYAQGRWCVVWDEFWFMCTMLKLENEARLFLQQARSNKIAFVMGAQRPSRIPLELFDQASHLFFSRDNDEVNLKRISGVGWLAANPIRSFVANLDPYQFLYVNPRQGWMVRTTAPEPPG